MTLAEIIELEIYRGLENMLDAGQVRETAQAIAERLRFEGFLK